MPIPKAPITGRLRATPAQPSSPAPIAPEQENKRQKGIASVETAIELLRINEEYLALTGDRTEHIYQCGKNVQALTTNQEYNRLLALFAKAFETQGAVESEYLRFSQDGVQRRYHVKVKFLSGDTLRSLYFITYMPATDPQPSGEAIPPLSLCPPPQLPLTRQGNDPEK